MQQTNRSALTRPARTVSSVRTYPAIDGSSGRSPAGAWPVLGSDRLPKRSRPFRLLSPLSRASRASSSDMLRGDAAPSCDSCVPSRRRRLADSGDGDGPPAGRAPAVAGGGEAMVCTEAGDTTSVGARFESRL